MKHISTLLIAALAALVLTACSGKAPQADRHAHKTHAADVDTLDEDAADDATTSNVPLHFGKTTWKDVRMVRKPSCATVEYDIRYADGGPEALVRNINLWVAGQFGLRDGVTPESLPTLVRKEAVALLAEDAANIEANFDPESEYTYEMQYSRSYMVRVEYTTPEYVTLCSQVYLYSGGAHGGTLLDYATFRLSDGHKMDWELLKGMPRPEINRAIHKGLMDYFEVNNEEDFQNALLSDAANLPLPQTPPFLTKKGVEIIYQQYEIACYAAGMPTCVVSPKPVLGK